MNKCSIGLLLSSCVFACSPASPNEGNDAGNGGSDSGGGNGACTLTISGAVTETTGCTIAATDDAQGLHFGVVSSDMTFAFASDLPGSSLSTGTFALSATTKTVSTVTQSTSVWAEMYDDGTHANQGDATFTLSSTGQELDSSSGHAWINEHGTLSATLAPADQFASGTVTVSVTF
jgi:hypothetical protein